VQFGTDLVEFCGMVCFNSWLNTTTRQKQRQDIFALSQSDENHVFTRSKQASMALDDPAIYTPKYFVASVASHYKHIIIGLWDDFPSIFAHLRMLTGNLRFVNRTWKSRSQDR
jgi:hypothetical protein